MQKRSSRYPPYDVVKALAHVVFYKLCCEDWIEDCEDLEDFLNESCEEV
ncbi:MAG: hypothetical protein N3G48_07675 [Sulfolobales archaeon]|nr:hypothetical protein [Sulfolobales archaeon]